jgi:hypothetical protein
MGATITKASLIAGSTALIGGTASRVVVTNAAGNVTTSSILQDNATDFRILSGVLRVEDGTFSAPSIRRDTDARGLFFDPVPSIAGGTGFRVYGDATTISAILGAAGSLVNAVQLGSTGQVVFTSASGAGSGAIDLGVSRSGPSIAEVNNGTAGTRGDLIVRNLHASGYLHAQTGFAYGAHVVTIANNTVGAQANGETLSGARSLYLISCNDPDGCALTLGESGIDPGTIVTIVNIDANDATMGDAAPHHLAGALTLTSNDAVRLLFLRNRSGDTNWYELTRSTN